MWTRIRFYILLEALQEMESVTNEKKKEQLYRKLGSIFNVSKRDLIYKNSSYDPRNYIYIYFDKPLFEVICNYLLDVIKDENQTSYEKFIQYIDRLVLSENKDFNYQIKPSLSEKQLFTIQYALDSIAVFITHYTKTIPNCLEYVKRELIVYLGTKYNIATEHFVDFYSKIFDDMNSRITPELAMKNSLPYQLMSNIYSKSSTIDPVLFSEILIHVRSRMADTLNFIA